MMSKQTMGNVDVNVTTLNDFMQEILGRLISGVRSRVFFLNAHCYNVAQVKPMYREHLNAAEFVLNDGLGVQLAAKWFNFSFPENLNGTDLTPKVLTMAEHYGFKVFLLGSMPGVAERAANQLAKRMKDLQIVGFEHGYFEDSEAIIAKVNDSGADIVIVAMGVPLQEDWISINWSKLSARLVMGVGAYLDFESQRVRRAPTVIRKLKLEWVFRLFREPRRLWKRYLVGNVLFFLYIWREGRRRHAHVGKHDS